MGSGIDTILMFVKFGDGPIISLDFSFFGGVPLIDGNKNFYKAGPTGTSRPTDLC